MSDNPTHGLWTKRNTPSGRFSPPSLLTRLTWRLTGRSNWGIRREN